MIPVEAVEAVANRLYPGWDNSPADWKDYFRRKATEALEAAAPYMLAEATKLIRDLTDPDECQFDHHGGCQAHGYLSLEQDETCPQADAKEWAANGDD